MMILLLLTIALASADPLREALQSSDKLLQLFSQFQRDNNRGYTSQKGKIRVLIFRKNVRDIVETNEQDLGWKAGINFFSDLTEEEGAQYLGLNMSLPQTPGTPLPLSSAPAAVSLDWREKGAVTPVKSQGRCGSCWTFSVVGSSEGVHQIKTGNLVKFAEQELLDCVYEGKRDGCKGGWMSEGFKYMHTAQRLAPSNVVKYRAKDGACRYNRIANGLQRKVSGYYDVPKNEEGHVSALSRGPIAVAFEVTSKMKQYKSGVLKDTTCKGWPNHAVTMVGYNAESFAIKNSWGGHWGDGGYVHMSRHHHNCKLYENSSLLELSNEKPDPNPQPTEPPQPTDPPTDPPVCEDAWPEACKLQTSYLCSIPAHRHLHCKKTCKVC